MGFVIPANPINLASSNLYFLTILPPAERFNETTDVLVSSFICLIINRLEGYFVVKFISI